MTFLSAFTVDESTLPAQQDAALGFFGGANWAPDLDNPQNKEFVAAYEKEFNAVPGDLRVPGLRRGAVDRQRRARGGRQCRNKDALRAALKKADFKSLRGGFKFNTNHYPIQDFYLVKVAKRADGKFQTQIVKKVFENYADTARQGLPDEVRGGRSPPLVARMERSIIPGSRPARPPRIALRFMRAQRLHVHHSPRRPDPQRAAARCPAVPDRGRAHAGVRRDGLHQPGARRPVHAGRLSRGRCSTPSPDNFLVALVLALGAALLFGLLLEFVVFRHLYDRDHLDQVIATFGIILFLNQG